VVVVVAAAVWVVVVVGSGGWWWCWWWWCGDGGGSDTSTDSDGDLPLPDFADAETVGSYSNSKLGFTCVLVFDVVYGSIINIIVLEYVHVDVLEYSSTN
jgi:hypothetical protein